MFALKSLNAKLLAIYVPLVCASVLLYFGTLEYQEYREARAELVGSLDHLASVQSTALASAVWEYDTDQIDSLLADLEKLNFIQGAAVYDAFGELLGAVGDHEAEPELSEFRSETQLKYASGSGTESVGRLIITVHSKEIWTQQFERMKLNAVVVAFLAMILVGVTFLATRVVIGRPIGRLQQAIERMRTSHTRERVDWQSADELGRVVDAFNRNIPRAAPVTRERNS